LAEREKLIRRLAVASAIIGNLPEIPGYNGSVLAIDDTEADRIAADLDEICAALSASKQGGEAEGWQPLATAPDGARVLLGPRHAPVVGIVRQMPEWADEQEPIASVIHYNGATLVAGYHCSEWHPLPPAPAAQPQGDKA
jgi:hypothetical protein